MSCPNCRKIESFLAKILDSTPIGDQTVSISRSDLSQIYQELLFSMDQQDKSREKLLNSPFPPADPVLLDEWFKRQEDALEGVPQEIGSSEEVPPDVEREIPF